ncbi:MAG: SGNH/GDSL hydrolase family protein [Curvibacter sp.]|nr:SGNH/GDSL hydrolase family protein [Curvibacter sp.]
MTGNWTRRLLVLAACASAALLSACGSSTIDSALVPSRIISFGDGLSDLGQTGTRYTVNDNTTNIWTQQFAANYGVNLSAKASGGTSYASAHVRVTLKPDAVGSSTSLTVSQQIDQFLANDSFGSNDVVLLNGGLSDLIVQAQSYTNDSSLDLAMTQAGKDLATQVRRLVTAGAKYVVVAGLYDASKSPWGVQSNLSGSLSTAVQDFNSALLVAINDLGSNVLFVDGAYYYNLLIGSPSSYGLTDSTDVACTSVDAGVGIGIGLGQVNSGLCNTNTLVSGIDYTKYAFADKVYFTPAAQVQFGNYAYGRIKARW